MNILRTLCTAAAIVGFAGAAQALPINSVFTPDNGPVSLSTGNPYSYTHDLLVEGFDPLNDVLSSAILTLDLSGAGGQTLQITLDGNLSYNASLNGFDELAVDLLYLQSDGLLNVSLTKASGGANTWSFASSTLFVDGDTGNTDPGDGGPGGSQIPAPAGLALMGLGLAGTGIAIRRRRKQA